MDPIVDILAETLRQAAARVWVTVYFYPPMLMNRRTGELREIPQDPKDPLCERCGLMHAP
jgi:hypothetical protein